MKGRMGHILAGVAIFLVIAVVGVLAARMMRGDGTVAVYGAVGGGKENLLADPAFLATLKDTYKLDPRNTAWSNGKLVVEPLTLAVDGKQRPYDFVFFSDERFYEAYTRPADASKGEAARLPVKKSSFALTTPIVFYSWDAVVDALIERNIVTHTDGVYYITDMPGLLDLIVRGTSWADIGLPSIYGKINIASTDPVNSSPGATYYGLLASVMNGGSVDESTLPNVLPQLERFYKLSGFMNTTPSDLFELYLRTGMGAKPIIVDYEKSIVDFANHNPDAWAQVQDRVRILYPSPTIWNSHCLIALTDAGVPYVDAYRDAAIQSLAWEKYGFRTGLTGGTYDVARIAVPGIPQDIRSVVPSLRKEVYDTMVEALRNTK